MSLKIYTYANPYEINKEPYWNEIKDCVHFCVSQTMVNGLEDIYKKDFSKHQLLTIRNFINSLYKNWEDLETCVNQIMEVDNAITSLKINSNNVENIKRSLRFNNESIVKCIRLFMELGITYEDINIDILTQEQQYLMEIFKIILSNDKSSFLFSHVKDLNNINIAIENTFKNKYNDTEFLQNIDKDTIIIHGIHQFSGSMLCAIEDLSLFKNVILLFNYQEQYKSIYQTWDNVYSLFEAKISKFTENQFVPMALMVDSYSSNMLAHSIGKLYNGEYYPLSSDILQELKVIEFENLTEFAGYVANIFENAQKKAKGQKVPVLSFMSEQMYSASNKVNDILKAYFPEQFGERHFLDYPIGHFFVAIVNMWDNENHLVKVDDFSNLKECISSGIFPEDFKGELLNTFNQIETFIEKENTLMGIIDRLKTLKKLLNQNNIDRKRVDYCQVAKQEVTNLINTLNELNSIIMSFFNDFNDNQQNFKNFYLKVQRFISNQISPLKDLDDEMKTVIKKLLERLEKSNLPNKGTFICLKQTMNYYLSQDENLFKSANWIVRDFEQIDGDILRSYNQDATKTCYHFCCLSDKDIYSFKNERLPYPLDIKFFNACNNCDWKYQIFIKSKMEYKNFKKYALVYGLQFNRVGCKLSYIKSENNTTNDVFNILKLLDIKITRYVDTINGYKLPSLDYPIEDIHEKEFLIVDSIKWNTCKYRFALESIIQDGTVFHDRFLIHNYIKVLMTKYIKNNIGNENINIETVSKAFEEINRIFRISNELEKTQLVSEVQKNIYKYRYNRPELMELREDFLFSKNLKDYIRIDNINFNELVSEKKFYYNIKKEFCDYCSVKNICLQYHNHNQND